MDMENDEKLNNPPSVNPIAETQPDSSVISESVKPVFRARKFIEAELPDKVFASDEDYDNAIADYLDNAKRTVSESKQAGESIAQIVMDNPELADIIADLKSGVSFRVALAQQFDPSDLTVGEDEPDAEQYKKAVDERRKRYEDSQQRIRSREENMEVSQKEFDQFMESSGWEPERQQEFVDWMQGFFTDFGNGKITKDVLVKLRKAFEYDDAVEEARQEGEIDGRNTAIETKRVKKATAGDGLPTGGTGTVLPDRPVSGDKDLIDEVLENSRRRAW